MFFIISPIEICSFLCDVDIFESYLFTIIYDLYNKNQTVRYPKLQ